MPSADSLEAIKLQCVFLGFSGDYECNEKWTTSHLMFVFEWFNFGILVSTDYERVLIKQSGERYTISRVSSLKI